MNTIDKINTVAGLEGTIPSGLGVLGLQPWSGKIRAKSSEDSRTPRRKRTARHAGPQKVLECGCPLCPLPLRSQPARDVRQS